MPGQIDGHVNPESTGIRHRVDQPGERRGAAERKIAAFGVAHSRDMCCRESLDRLRDMVRLESGAIDDGARAQAWARLGSDENVETADRLPQCRDGGAVSNLRP